MKRLPNTVVRSRTANLLSRPVSLSSYSHHGRSAPYRRLSTLLPSSQRDRASINYPLQSSIISAQSSSPVTTLASAFARQLSTTSPLFNTPNPQKKPESSSAPRSDPPGSKSDPASTKPEAEAKADAESAEKASAESSDKSESQSEAKDEQKKEGEGEEKEGEKKEEAPPPPHGDKTPWQVFVDTLSTEFKSSKDWNEGTKAIASGYQEFTQNPALQKAKSAYDASTSKTGEALKATGEVIGKGAAIAWDSPVGKVIRKGANAAGSGIDAATKPVRDTEAYKSVKNVIDDGSSSRYGGWIDKEERKKRRALRAAEWTSNAAAHQKLEEDPNAGTNITLHKDAAWKESWREFRQTSKLFQSIDSMKNVYDNSDNPLISTARAWADSIGGFFAENESAMVIKKLREIDPSFQLEPFLNDLREYILPEVLDAYVKGDTETLKVWLSAAQYNVYAALMQQYTTAGLQSDGRILDIRGVEVANARLLDPGEVPVFVITCKTQEVHVYRNKKTGDLAAGVDDKVQQVTYAIGITRIAEDVNNPETRGWRLIELQKSARDWY